MVVFGMFPFCGTLKIKKRVVYYVQDIEVSQMPNHRFYVSWTREFITSKNLDALKVPFTVFYF
jgi:hypothetical protein